MNKTEAQSYQRGYAAGVRNAKRAAEQALMDQLYLAFLPFAIEQDGWHVNGQQTKTSELRIELAAHLAKRAFRNRPIV